MTLQTFTSPAVCSPYWIPSLYFSLCCFSVVCMSPIPHTQGHNFSLWFSCCYCFSRKWLNLISHLLEIQEKESGYASWGGHFHREEGMRLSLNLNVQSFLCWHFYVPSLVIEIRMFGASEKWWKTAPILLPKVGFLTCVLSLWKSRGLFLLSCSSRKAYSFSWGGRKLLKHECTELLWSACRSRFFSLPVETPP